MIKTTVKTKMGSSKGAQIPMKKDGSAAYNMYGKNASQTIPVGKSSGNSKAIHPSFGRQTGHKVIRSTGGHR